MAVNDISIPFKELEKRFRSVMLRLPIIAGNEAINFILDNFRMQGFLGNSFQRWQPRKNPNKWGQKPPRNGRSLLVDTGKYRRSWRVSKVSPYVVAVGSDDPKAKVHNEGLRMGQIQSVKAHERKKFGKAKVSSGTFNVKTRKENTRSIKYVSGTIPVKAHTRKINQNIPARPVIGKSSYLDNRIKRVITAELMKALK